MSSYTYLTLIVLEDEIPTVQHDEPTGVQHERVACGKDIRLGERLGISSTEEYVGKLDESVLRRRSTSTAATQKALLLTKRSGSCEIGMICAIFISSTRPVKA